MRGVRIAFYKYNKKPLNLAISLWTWLPNMFTPWYSHCEIGFLMNGEWEYFSSTMRNGAKGTRWIHESDMIKHRERWDIYDIVMYERSANEMVDTANSVEGRLYDILGIFGFFIPFVNSKQKWYCSEVCWLILSGEWKKRISPRSFYRKANKLCGLKLLNG